MGSVLQIAALFFLSPGDVKPLRSVINPHISRYIMPVCFLDVTNRLLAFEYRMVVVAREVLDCLLFTSSKPKLGSSQSMVLNEGEERSWQLAPLLWAGMYILCSGKHSAALGEALSKKGNVVRGRAATGMAWG